MKLTDLIKKLKDFYKANGELDVVAGDAPVQGIELGAGRCILITEKPAAKVSVFDERVDDGPRIAVPEPSEVHSTRKFSKKE